VNIRKLGLKLLGLALPPGCGAKPDSVAEAVDKGISCINAGDLDSAIVAFTEAKRLGSSGE
jgi:hypothetical protein